MKVREKPRTLEAMQLLDSNADLVAKWCNGYVLNRQDNFEPMVQLLTLEGAQTARIRDYIIKDEDTGNFEIVSGKVFSKYYEVIEQ